MKKAILVLLILLVFIIGCAQQEILKEKAAEKSEQKSQMANPASVYCEEQGGKLEIRTNQDGSQTGYCLLQDGTECEEWTFYHGECQKKDEIKQEEAVQTEIPELNPNPIDTLSEDSIEKLGANCKNKKTDLEKANCLLDWQEKNIFWCYTHPEETVMPKMFETGYPDCVVDMQFQQMVPGSFPVSKIFELKLRNNKLFGACYTYATTYCALARWNGLKCRVMAVKITTPMDYSASKGNYDTGYCGVAQKSYLDALGLNCDKWNMKDWIINYDHYWAEVLINEKWQIMEKSTWAYMHDTKKNIIDTGRDYGDSGW